MQDSQNDKGNATTVGAVIAALLIVSVLGGLTLYGYANNLRSERISQETGLSNQYLANQNYLSDYMSKFYEKVGVAKLKSEKMDQILLDAVKGRYGDKGFSAQGGLFSAVAEAYPDIKGLDVFDKIADQIESGRTGYRQMQEKLLDMLRSYDKWREDGIIQHLVIQHIIGAPGDTLKARIGSDYVTRQAALDKMYVIVLTKGTKDAYTSGELEPLKP